MSRTAAILPALLLLLGPSLAVAGEDDPRLNRSPFEPSAHREIGCLSCHVPRMPTPEEYGEAQRFSTHFPLDPTAAVACMNCHGPQAIHYRKGLHYRAVTEGHLEAPHCVDCHAPPRPYEPGTDLLHVIRHGRGNPHAIADTRRRNPAVPVERDDMVCARCHANKDLAALYGWKADVVPTYDDSVHGRRAFLGSEKAPTCATCHRAHGSLKPSDPASPVHPDNVQETCTKCHKGAGRSFATAFRHARLTSDENPGLFWLEKGYVLLIVLVVGFLYAHVVLDVFTTVRLKLTGKLRLHSPEPLPPGTPPEIERLSENLRWQHVFMFVSTITLVVTGWPMKVYEAPLSRTIEDLFGGVDNARTVHRIAGLVLVGTLVWHLGYILLRMARRRARYDIVFVPEDVRHVLQQFLYYLGVREERPRYRKFSYSQKIEYTAVVWGTLIMGLSGAVLWSSDLVQHLPAWVHKAAGIVHGYEALLAAIAVFGFHFYNEHLRYQVFPMSRIWITGKADAFEYREEWPADFDRRFGTVASKPEKSDTAAEDE